MKLKHFTKSITVIALAVLIAAAFMPACTFESFADSHEGEMGSAYEENMADYQADINMDEKIEKPSGIASVMAVSYPDGASKSGIDISAWQDEINWEKVSKDEKVDFVIIRIGYTASSSKSQNVDKQWERNVENCEKYGIPYGIYYYSIADTTTLAAKEAKLVVNNLKDHKPKYPVYYDLEDPGIDKKSITSIAYKFCSTIELNGYKAGIYASRSWWDSHITDSKLDKYEKWVAHWISKETNPNKYSSIQKKTLVSYLANYKKAGYRILQYSDCGSVSGISGRVDMDYQTAMSNNSSYMKSVGKAIPEYLQSKITDVDDYKVEMTADSYLRNGPGYGYNKNSILKKGEKAAVTKKCNGFLLLKGTYEGYWIPEKNSKLYYDPTDVVKKSKNKNGDIILVQENGETAKSGWVTFEGKKYYAASTGAVAVGYKKIGDYYYGFRSDGSMLSGGTYAIGSKTYKFISSGKAVLYSAKTTDALNGRTGPGTGYKSKTIYKKGTILYILKTKNGWTYTSKGTWVKGSYLKKAVIYPQYTYKAKVTKKTTMRKGPGTSYGKAGTISKGKSITIKATKYGWGKMSNGYWIKLTYTKKI